MPFAAHGDIIATYHRSYLILTGDWHVSFHYLSPSLFFTICQIVQALFLVLCNHLLPLRDLLYWKDSVLASAAFWLNIFIRNQYAHRALFLFKLPYLIFDLATAVVLFYLFERKEERTIALKFWMINPIGIFAVYVFGRYETIPIFLVVLSLYCAKTNKRFFSFLLLGMVAMEQYYGLMFLPVYLAILGRNFRERLSFLIVGSIVVIRDLVVGSSVVVGRTFLESPFFNYLLAMRLDVTGQQIYVFVLTYVLLTLYWIHTCGKEFSDLWKFALAALLVFYATCSFHPNYFAWFTPFLAIAIAKYPELRKLHLLQVLCFVFYTFYWKRPLAGWLFASVDPSFFLKLLSPAELIDFFYPSSTIISVFRTILSGISLYMVLILARSREGR